MRAITILLLAIATCFGLSAGSPASAQAPAAATQQAPSYYRIRVGNYVVTALSDGTTSLALEKLLHGVKPADVRAAFSNLGETPARDISVNAFLVDTGKQRILIDAGAGALFGACCGRLPDVLAEAGYPPDSINAVLLTHVHGDHSGGLVNNGRLVFPNAEVYLAKAEYDFWMSDAEQARAKPSHKKMFEQGRAALAPYDALRRLRFFSGKTEVVPGISAIPAPGHTPGHTFYRIEDGSSSLLIISDTIHAAEVQFPNPAVTVDFDIDEPRARATREQALAELARTHELAAAGHISFPGLGHVVRDGQGYAWAPQPYSASVKEMK